MITEIQKLDFSILNNSNHPENKLELDRLKNAVSEYGFLILKNSPISINTLEEVFVNYKSFFNLPYYAKNKINMSKTMSNRGWGAPEAEQVNQDYNPDYKEIFDCGPNISVKHQFENLPYYSKNIWPKELHSFEKNIMSFYQSCTKISIQILKQIEYSLDYSSNYFANKFELPMALLRCNYYPPRPQKLTTKDFGIAPHTDYGCLTLLFTDGTPGLEIEKPSKDWEAVTSSKNEIIINFGDMLEIWSDKKIKATPHRVVGTQKERFSIPFFFNPQYDTIISKEKNIIAGEYLSERYNSTYVHKIK